ncbi:cupin domain-containing protein [Spongisporangium articulatum]|uniref:Cupin domain-containing protein n=1 Tax=Spongisporangium articulatum TaxID=3362603 RepID=A0ABW8APG0_9ACTN
MEMADRTLPAEPDVIAPDGSQVRILCGVDGASTAHFRLRPGQVSVAVVHATVSEVWYVLRGRGVMWRRQGASESELALVPGVSLSIPVGTAFQFRAEGGADDEPLEILGVTAPPWPGEGEASPVEGRWEPAL